MNIIEATNLLTQKFEIFNSTPFTKESLENVLQEVRNLDNSYMEAIGLINNIKQLNIDFNITEQQPLVAPPIEPTPSVEIQSSTEVEIIAEVVTLPDKVVFEEETPTEVIELTQINLFEDELNATESFEDLIKEIKNKPFHQVVGLVKPLTRSIIEENNLNVISIDDENDKPWLFAVKRSITKTEISPIISTINSPLFPEDLDSSLVSDFTGHKATFPRFVLTPGAKEVGSVVKMKTGEVVTISNKKVIYSN